MTSPSPSPSPSPELRWPAKDHRVFDVFRSDNEKARGRHTLATIAHKLDAPMVRVTGWSLMSYLFQPRPLDGRRLERSLVLRHIGSKTGTLRENVLSAFETDGGWFVIGSNGGLRNDPAWVKNLRATPVCWVTWARQEHNALAVELLGDQYDAVWADLEVRHPVLPGYRAKAAAHGRRIPVILLERRG